MIKKILVPTDFSEVALSAAKVASGIARKSKAEIIFLHVMDIPVYYDNDKFSSHQDIGETLGMLKWTRTQFKKLFEHEFLKGIKVVEAVQFEGIYKQITGLAKEHKVDLIVMGTHGSSGVSELMVGSNTERIVRLASCPVLSVKEGDESFSPRRIVFASNFIKETQGACDPIFDFARLFKAELHLLKVNTPSNFDTTRASIAAIQKFKDEVALLEGKIAVYNDYTVEEGIRNYANDVGADMVAIETHGRKGIGHLLIGSLAEDISNHLKKPVLSIKMN